MKQLNPLLRWLVPALLVVWAGLAQAAGFSQIYVFGDSLSDIGNLHAVDPSRPVRFSNGPVAVEDLAQDLGLSLSPSLHLLPPGSSPAQYGNDYAVAGAVAIDNDGNPATPDINVPTQVNAFLQIHGGHAPADALYVMMIGGNDIFAAQDILMNGSWDSGIAADQRVAKAANAVQTELGTLIAAGARHILVVDAPDVGKAPITRIKAAQLAANATNFYQTLVASELPDLTRGLSVDYDLRLALAVDNVEEATQINIKQYSLFKLLDKLTNNPDEYGYTNVTDPCLYELTVTTPHLNPSCDFNSWLFYDEIHPTAITHKRAGDAMAALYQ